MGVIGLIIHLLFGLGGRGSGGGIPNFDYYPAPKQSPPLSPPRPIHRKIIVFLTL